VSFILVRLSQQIFKKYTNIKFHENPSSGSQVVPHRWMGRWTDGHEDANSHISQFCGHASKLKTKKKEAETENIETAKCRQDRKQGKGTKEESKKKQRKGKV
jgi:hypothetical protein